MESVSLITALAFGLLSFVSPCVLPIVPGYLSFISGVSFDAMQSTEQRSIVRKRIAVSSLFFIFGFSLVFVALGASATFVGQFLKDHLSTITKVAGVVIIIFGLHMVGVFKIPFLNYEKRFNTAAKPISHLGAALVGMAFAFGWTPCIGPFLATILTIASQEDTVWKGIALLSAYSLGLGVPFFIAGLSITVFYNVFHRFKRHLHKVEIVGGTLLIIVGILIMMNALTIFSGYLSRWFPFLNDLG